VGVDRQVVVVGYRAELVREKLGNRPGVEFAEQREQLGTGHAVLMCRSFLERHEGPVLIVTGDSPMTQSSSLAKLLREFSETRPACLLGTLEKDDPTGLGRIVRDDHGRFLGIVEEKDATPEQRAIREVNMSTYVFDSRALLGALGELTNDNRQGEYYITDCPGILRSKGLEVRALPALQPCEALSVNTVEQLAEVEEELRKMVGE
jgi:bifunctional UDP-N-acetylglucosamine pyrophosphorylase/glucosamine-1-phosphate N-acetyltransferase/UDP-N-acetylglucosamine pyrophosphorylase